MTWKVNERHIAAHVWMVGALCIPEPGDRNQSKPENYIEWAPVHVILSLIFTRIEILDPVYIENVDAGLRYRRSGLGADQKVTY